MLELKKVLCPIDFSNLAARELNLAVQVCEAFGSKLVLHHNVLITGVGFSKAWEWSEEHRAQTVPEGDAFKRLEGVLATLPPGVRAQAEAKISSGSVAPVLLMLAQHLPADLVVLGSHGWSTDDHSSVTERIVDKCPCPVLTFHEGHEQAFRLQPKGDEPPAKVLVPTDLSEAAARAVNYAFELARRFPLHLTLLHVVPSGAGVAAAEQKLGALVPSDLAPRIETAIHQGKAVEDILDTVEAMRPAFMVVGEHKPGGLFHRLFSQNRAREILHRASCPVWFIPNRG